MTVLCGLGHGNLATEPRVKYKSSDWSVKINCYVLAKDSWNRLTIDSKSVFHK